MVKSLSTKQIDLTKITILINLPLALKKQIETLEDGVYPTNQLNPSG
jgi:hypothetical protein